MRTIIVTLASILVLITSASGANLPWYETYFFPISPWHTFDFLKIPKDDDWTDWDNRIDNQINWVNFDELGFDTARVKCSFVPESEAQAKNDALCCYDNRDITYGEFTNLVYANRDAVNHFKDIDARVQLWAGDFYYITTTKLYGIRDEYGRRKLLCWPGECGGQGGTLPPPEDPENPYYYDEVYYCFYKPNIRNDIMDYLESTDAGIDIEDTILDQYNDLDNLIWYTALDEPVMWEMMPLSVLHEYMDDYSPEKIPIPQILDRTGRDDQHVYDDITNFYEYATCLIGSKIQLSRDYPLRFANPPNSAEVYTGYYDTAAGFTDHGLYGSELHLSRARESTLKYAIPLWHVAGIFDETHRFQNPAPGSPRYPTPRELRAEVNMSLTYGAKGVWYFNPFNTTKYVWNEEEEYAELVTIYKSAMDRDGDVNVGSYYDGQDGEKDFFAPEGITYQTLYNELVDLNTKLHSVRDTLQTTVSLDAFRYEDIPRSLVCDYVGNRDRGEDDDYPPDYEDCVDFLDFGTFVCPYTGVRYFAVSDRFCNWPPATYGDPFEDDEITVRHPGRIIFDVYDDDPEPDYFTFFNIDNYHYDNGASTFEFDLDNADGDCIWMVSSDTDESMWYFYERYPDGGVGPHGDFTFGALPPVTGLAYGEDQLLALIGLDVSYRIFYRNGDYVGWGQFDTGIGRLRDGRGICYADTDYEFWGYGGPYFFVMCESSGREEGYIIVQVFDSTGGWMGTLSIYPSDGYGTGIAYGKIQYNAIIDESFGKIKAYFE